MHKTDQHIDHLNEQELLRKYLAGTLSSEEELQVADLYEHDAEFRDTLDGMEAIGEEEYTASMDRLSSRLDARLSSAQTTRESGSDNVIQMHAPVAKQQSSASMRRFAIAASVAFLILLGGTIFVHQMQSPTARLVASNFEPKPYPDVITRGGSDDLSEQEKIAISAYNAGNNEVAEEQFTALYGQNPEIVKYGLFLGISQMSSNHYDQAVETLAGLKDNAGVYEADVLWYLGLAYLKQKKKSEALPLFEKLAADPETYYSSAAQEIIAKLK